MDAAVLCVVDSSQSSTMSKVEIIRVLISEKITVALREILAVVETTVAGYEDEVLSLRRELGEKMQLEILQPRVLLPRIVVDDAGGAPGIWSTVPADESKDELRFTHKDLSVAGASERCTGENGVDVDATKVSHEEPQLEHEESERCSLDLHSYDSESCPENTEEGLTHDPIPDVRITQSKRRRRLPGRYRSENEGKAKRNEKSSKVKKRQVVDKPMTSLEGEAPSETGGTDQLTDLQENMSSMDCADQSEDGEDEAWSPEQNNEDKEHCGDQTSGKKMRKKGREKVLNFDPFVDDAGGAPGIWSTVPADESKDELRFTHKDLSVAGASERCTGENGVDVDATKVSHEEPQLEHEESERCSLDLHSYDSESCPENTEEGLTHDPIPDVRITQSKRRRRLPGRYRSENEGKAKRNEKSSKVKKRQVVDKPMTSTGENGVDVDATKVSHEEPQLEHEESERCSLDLHSHDSESCPENTEEGLTHDPIPDVTITQSKRRRRLPGRYRSNHNVTDEDSEKDSENEGKAKRNKKSSKVKKRQVVKLRICLLKNCPDADQSNKDFSFNDSVQTILCQQNVSESFFLNNLRSTFPELGENKPFVAFLAHKNQIKRTIPNGAKRMTPTELYRAFTSDKREAFNFYIKEHEESCDSLKNALTVSHDKPMTSGLGEAPSETGGSDKLTDKRESMSSMDCADQSEDGEDDDEAWSPEQNNEDEGHCNNPKSEKKIRKKGREKVLNSNPCKLCGIIFTSNPILTKHALSHLDDPKCMCGVCGQQLESSEELKSHLETHQKLHQCGACGRYFLTYVHFRKHNMTCQLQRTAQDNDALWTKLTVNQKDKPHKCDVCPQSFRCIQQLLFHNSEHTGKAPFWCQICGKSQSNYANYHRHKRTHSGERKYSCQHCQKRFYRISNLKQHEKNMHTVREKNYLCDICSMAFYTEESLKSHQIIHGERSYVKCPVCNKLIKREFKQHMALHTEGKPVSCEECGMKFKCQKYLMRHMKRHRGIKPFSCTVCGYKCARKAHLKDHMNTHTGHRPYRCSLCDKGFTQRHCVKTHMKRQHTEEQ